MSTLNSFGRVKTAADYLAEPCARCGCGLEAHSLKLDFCSNCGKNECEKFVATETSKQNAFPPLPQLPRFPGK